MAGVNKAILLGNLGKDPEMRKTQSGKSVVSATIATSDSYTDANGQKQTDTQWHNLVVWGKAADVFAQYLKKGSKVYIEGKTIHRSWDDKDGNKRYSTEVNVQDFQFLDPAPQNQQQGQQNYQQQGYNQAPQQQNYNQTQQYQQQPQGQQQNYQPQNQSYQQPVQQNYQQQPATQQNAFQQPQGQQSAPLVEESDLQF